MILLGKNNKLMTKDWLRRRHFQCIWQTQTLHCHQGPENDFPKVTANRVAKSTLSFVSFGEKEANKLARQAIRANFYHTGPLKT